MSKAPDVLHNHPCTHSLSITHGQVPGSLYSRRLHREMMMFITISAGELCSREGCGIRLHSRANGVPPYTVNGLLWVALDTGVRFPS